MEVIGLISMFDLTYALHWIPSLTWPFCIFWAWYLHKEGHLLSIWLNCSDCPVDMTTGGGGRVIRLTCGFSLYLFVTLITWSNREGSEDLKTELSAEVSIGSVRFDRKAAFTWRDFKSDQSSIPLFVAHVNTAAVYTDAPFLQFTFCKRLHVEKMFSVQAVKDDV